MKFNINREKLLPLIQQVNSVVGKKQTSPILSYLLLKLTSNTLSVTATDTEVELVTVIKEQFDTEKTITVSAQKILDICRNLPTEAELHFEINEERIKIRAGNSRFTLSSLPASEFPVMSTADYEFCFTVKRALFNTLIEKVRFAMAQQDVRYYLNGLLVEVEPEQLNLVATDGHRLALGVLPFSAEVNEKKQFIIPKKGVTELTRLLSNKTEEEIEVKVGANFICIEIDDTSFTSKLIDGAFPNYQRVIPDESEHKITVNRMHLKQGLMRMAILSNERYRNVRLVLSADKIRLFSHNFEKEEAEEEINTQYKGADLEVGFNILYLLEALDSIDTERVYIHILDANSSCLILPDDDSRCKYVVMPIRL